MFNIYVLVISALSNDDLDSFADFNIDPNAIGGDIAGTVGEHDVVALLEAFHGHLISIENNTLIISI